MKEITITKHPVIGHLVVKEKYKEIINITTIPLMPDFENGSALQQLEDFQELIAVIPAQPETFIVGTSDDILGFEFKGADNPNWLKVAQKQK